MTLRQIATQLQKAGHQVTYRTRSDGGILITSIDGQRFKGAAGNILARKMTGQELSSSRGMQLRKITYARRYYKIKHKIIIPPELEVQRKAVARLWKKAGLKGSISKYNLRRIIEEKGIEYARTYFSELVRYTQDKATYSYIQGLIDRLTADIENTTNSYEKQVLEELVGLIESKKESMTAEQVGSILQELYNWENDTNYSIDTLVLKIRNLLS